MPAIARKKGWSRAGPPFFRGGFRRNVRSGWKADFKLVGSRMAAQSVRVQVLEIVARFAGERDLDEDSYVSRLFPDWWDCIDLCEHLEKSYGIDLRPFFEESQPEVGWGPWKRKVARDVKAAELADHVEQLVTRPS